jgi:uncharacterized protein YcbX
MANATLRAISTYPVKGLSALDWTAVDVAVGQTLPLDRAYAIENGPGAFDPAQPRHLPKVTFLCLMRDARLAHFHTTLDTTAGRHDLLISRNGKPVVSGDLKTETGRGAIEAFFAVEMADSLRGPPKVVSAADHSFSDVKEKCVHIINLASVRALEAAMGRMIDPLRFRANLLIDGLAPWAELDGVGRTLAMGDARFEVFKRTVRCAATNVDPQTAERDADVPAAIEALSGHRDFGVYAVVSVGGTLRVGDTVSGFIG